VVVVVVGTAVVVVGTAVVVVGATVVVVVGTAVVVVGATVVVVVGATVVVVGATVVVVVGATVVGAVDASFEAHATRSRVRRPPARSERREAIRPFEPMACQRDNPTRGARKQCRRPSTGGAGSCHER
jgi:hypothetical protein